VRKEKEVTRKIWLGRAVHELAPPGRKVGNKALCQRKRKIEARIAQRGFTYVLGVGSEKAVEGRTALNVFLTETKSFISLSESHHSKENKELGGKSSCGLSHSKTPTTRTKSLDRKESTRANSWEKAKPPYPVLQGEKKKHSKEAVY